MAEGHLWVAENLALFSGRGGVDSGDEGQLS
jgi:hypothetical protein